MKVSKTNNRFKTGFPKPITGLSKNPILTSLVISTKCVYANTIIQPMCERFLHFVCRCSLHSKLSFKSERYSE